MPLEMSVKNFVAVIVLAAATIAARATPVVILSPTFPQSAAEVDSIFVNGIDYNVRFDAGTSFTFQGQLSFANTAANELSAALNTSPAVSVLSFFGPLGQFYIQEGATGMGPVVQNALGFGTGQQGAWQVNSIIGLSQYFGASFTPVTMTPEPSSLVLLGTGAAALVGAATRRKASRTY